MGSKNFFFNDILVWKPILKFIIGKNYNAFKSEKGFSNKLLQSEGAMEYELKKHEF